VIRQDLSCSQLLPTELELLKVIKTVLLLMGTGVEDVPGHVVEASRFIAMDLMVVTLTESGPTVPGAVLHVSTLLWLFRLSRAGRDIKSLGSICNLQNHVPAALPRLCFEKRLILPCPAGFA
jgi:hypothetical protein